MVWVYADLGLLGGERELAGADRLELVVRLEIWPAEDAAVDYVGQAFSV